MAMAATLASIPPGCHASDALAPERHAEVPRLAAPRMDLEGRVEDHVPMRSWQENEEEAKAYCQTLIQAHTLGESLSQSARHDVTFAHLFEEPHKYRGEVVHFRGRLTRLRRFDAPRFVQKPYEMPYLYEGWMFDSALYGANPLCIVFTQLPAGLQIQETMNTPVTFDGYFFKRFRYTAGDAIREAPLLIGHAPRLESTSVTRPPPAEGAFPPGLVQAFLALVAGTIALILGLAWWFNRGDRRVRALVRQAEPEAFLPPDSVHDAQPFPWPGPGGPPEERCR
jgi:hypothetical protein